MQEADEWAAHGHFAEAAAAIDRATGLAAEATTGDGYNGRIAPTARTRRPRDSPTRQTNVSGSRPRCTPRSASRELERGADGGRRAAGDRAAARGGRPGAAPAWKAVGMDVTQRMHGRRPAGTVSLAVDNARPVRRPAVHARRHRAPVRSIPWQETNIRSERCCGSTRSAGSWSASTTAIVLGQPSPGESIAVPILADLSRRHAVIRRDAGRLRARAAAATCASTAARSHGPFVLADNQLIQLGDNVRIRFTKPHALSATARLVARKPPQNAALGRRRAADGR